MPEIFNWTIILLGNDNKFGEIFCDGLVGLSYGAEPGAWWCSAMHYGLPQAARVRFEG